MERIIEIRDIMLSKIHSCASLAEVVEILGVSRTTVYRMLRYSENVMWNNRFQIRRKKPAPFVEPTVSRTFKNHVVKTYYITNVFTNEVSNIINQRDAIRFLGITPTAFKKILTQPPGFYVTKTGYTVRKSSDGVGSRTMDPYIGMLNLYPNMNIVVMYNDDRVVLYNGVEAARRDMGVTTEYLKKIIRTKELINGYRFMDYRRYSHKYGSLHCGGFITDTVVCKEL